MPRYSADEMRTLIASRDDALEKAILAIYARQTDDEQRTESTNHRNGRGFTGADAFILSEFAKQIARSTRPKGSRLSPRQRELARRKMAKYGAQLAVVANEREANGRVVRPVAPTREVGVLPSNRALMRAYDAAGDTPLCAATLRATNGDRASCYNRPEPGSTLCSECTMHAIEARGDRAQTRREAQHTLSF